MRCVTVASAGVVLALSALQTGAADLPAKAQAVEYAKMCFAYGAGYYQIPGTDTCLNFSGYARVDAYVNATGGFNPAIASVADTMFSSPGAGVGGYPLVTKTAPTYLAHVRSVFNLDARTATDYGVLRSYIRMSGEWDSEASVGGPPGAAFDFERAFIQFAGFTFGYTQSFFDSGVQYMFTQHYGGSNKTTLIGYTLPLDAGLSLWLSLEDPVNRTTGTQDAPASGTFSNGTQLTGLNGIVYVDSQSGRQAPDMVFNVQLDRDWARLMVSGALHNVSGITPTGYAGTLYPGAAAMNTWGGALGLSAEFQLPMLAPGDSIYFQYNYANGALAYLGLSGSYEGRVTGLGRITLNGTSPSGAFYPIADAVWTGSDYAKETGWALETQFRHFWRPNLRSSAYAGYVRIDVPANAVFSPSSLALLPAGALFNQGFSIDVAQVGLNTVWSPVTNLDLGVEVLYSKVSGSLPLTSGIIAGTPQAGTLALFGGSVGIWAGGVRAQRNF